MGDFFDNIRVLVNTNDYETLGSLFYMVPNLINERSRDGKTLLFYARTPQMAQFLIDNGIDVNAMDSIYLNALSHILTRFFLGIQMGNILQQYIEATENMYGIAKVLLRGGIEIHDDAIDSALELYDYGVSRRGMNLQEQLMVFNRSILKLLCQYTNPCEILEYVDYRYRNAENTAYDVRTNRSVTVRGARGTIYWIPLMRECTKSMSRRSGLPLGFYRPRFGKSGSRKRRT